MPTLDESVPTPTPPTKQVDELLETVNKRVAQIRQAKQENDDEAVRFYTTRLSVAVRDLRRAVKAE